MGTRKQSLLAFIFVGGLLFDGRPAQATAIAMSNIAAVNLSITSAQGTITFDPFTLFAFAQAQNSLGDLDAQFDFDPSNPAVANAMVTWADGHATIGSSAWSASSNVNIPGSAEGAANSQGQGSLESGFTIACTGPSCGSDTQVTFSVDLSGQLDVMTDLYGQLATTETIFNLDLDGTPLLFDNRILSIGPNDAQSQIFAFTLSGSQTLLYDTPYSFLVHVDSESQAINTPEPASITLLCLGLAVALRFRRGRVVGVARTATKL